MATQNRAFSLSGKRMFSDMETDHKEPSSGRGAYEHRCGGCGTGNTQEHVRSRPWLPDELLISTLMMSDSPRAVAAWAATSMANYALARDQGCGGGSTGHGSARRDPASWGRDWRWAFRARACNGRTDGTTIGEVDFTMNGQNALYWGDLVGGKPDGLEGFCATLPAGGAACRYEGQFANGQRHGRGICTLADGSSHEGDYFCDKMHGRGIWRQAQGKSYEGDYIDGQRCGQGVYTWANGNQYKGRFISDDCFVWARRLHLD